MQKQGRALRGEGPLPSPLHTGIARSREIGPASGSLVGILFHRRFLEGDYFFFFFLFEKESEGEKTCASGGGQRERES